MDEAIQKWLVDIDASNLPAQNKQELHKIVDLMENKKWAGAYEAYWTIDDDTRYIIPRPIFELIQSEYF